MTDSTTKTEPLGDTEYCSRKEAPGRKPGGNVRTFLDRIYWLLGTFCLAWSASAVVGILRRHSLELPVLGKTDTTETVIFTLLGFGFLVPLLLYVVATWRGVAALRHWRARYPGAASDEWEIPKSFVWLRGLFFVALVCFPVATMQLCYHRMLGFEIHWIGDGEKVVLKQDNPPGRRLFDFPPKPAPNNDYANWRWIGGATEDVQHPSKMTAAPGYMPWAFWAISYSSCIVAIWFLVTPSGTLRRLVHRARLKGISNRQI